MNPDHISHRKFILGASVVAAILIFSAHTVSRHTPSNSLPEVPEEVSDTTSSPPASLTESAPAETLIPTLSLAEALSAIPSDESAEPLSSSSNQIILEKLGLMFDLPKGYTAYQKEGFEGGYGLNVVITKDVTPGHVTYAAITMRTFYGEQVSHETPHEPFFSAKNYLSALVKQINLKEAEATHFSFHSLYRTPAKTTLAGREALFYEYDEVDLSYHVVTVLSGSWYDSEYLGLEISSSTYGTGAQFNPALFKQIVLSLRPINK